MTRAKRPPPVSRDAIVDAAIRVLDRDGPRSSMEAIAAEAGITKPRLYRQFTDKGDLYTAIGNRFADTAFAATGTDLTLLLQPPREAIARALGDYAAGILDHPNVFRFLAQAQTGSTRDGSVWQYDLSSAVANRFAKRARAVADSIPLDTGGIDYLARGIVGVMIALTDLWLTEPVPDPAEFVDRAGELVWGMINAFLRGRGVDADSDVPIFVTLAALNQDSERG
ncbi:TetR/AcrR family transcriptional regulator [Nocardia mangyaensis]|uniref:TetR/AcrR family transcriptional regulator n=1 Tax=Nocardia mangyaensis TaxID=2213200 RepID=UPI002674E2F1|nr:TetR/AcrR family transcriptional regulator [Nocardia mangyaensis]MDO3650918.1 TetR/AcrR family transcriptional regulator [Nocardia mangyaensis]